MTRCECSEPGWCQRHGVNKSPHLFHLCQTSEKYWQAWEDGRGPRQRVSSRKVEYARPRGLGDVLRHIMGCCTFPHATIFNRWGVTGTRQRFDEALLLVKAAGTKGGMPLGTEAARRILLLAMDRAENTPTSEGPTQLAHPT